MKTLSKLMLLWFVLMCAPSQAAITAPEVIVPANLTDKLKTGDYTAQIYVDRPSKTNGVIRILKGKDVVYEDQGHIYQFVSFGQGDEASRSIEARDITGDGEKDLAVWHWSGGAHCCSDYKVFSLGKEFRVLSDIDLKDAGGRFVDLDSDGIYELITNDTTFLNWNASYADSPVPEVVLRLKDGKYVPAYDLMQKPLLSKEEADDLCGDNKKENQPICGTNNWGWTNDGTCVTPDVWGVMLHYIYTGHPKEALAFLDRWWKGSPQAKEKFLKDFKDQLALSPYAQELHLDLQSLTSS